MKIRIYNDRTIAQLQADFSKVFPYLKIEFYSVPYKAHSLLPKAKLIRHDVVLRQLRDGGKEGDLVLTPELSVAALEQKMWEDYILSVQVFRKSGSLWIETSLTDSWTLKQQNYEGEQMSIAANDKTEGIDLYDRDQAE